MRILLKSDGEREAAETRSFSSACTAAKETLRSEISAQIEEFLRHGGQIKTLETGAGGDSAHFGNVWHGHDEPHSYVDPA